MFKTNAKKYYAFPQSFVSDWDHGCSASKGKEKTHGDKSVCHHCGGDPPRHIREAQHRACERYARERKEGGARADRGKPRTPSRSDHSSPPRAANDDNRQVEKVVDAVLRKLGNVDSSASTRTEGDGSSRRSYRDAAGGRSQSNGPNNNSNHNGNTSSCNNGAPPNSTTNNTGSNNTNSTDASDAAAAPSDGDETRAAIEQAKELVGDLEMELRSAKADAKKRSTARMVKRESDLQQQLDEAKAELGRLQNSTRDTSDRLAFAFKRIKQLQKWQEREIAKCRAAVATIQDAESDWDNARKEHLKLAAEITELQSLTDQLRPVPKAEPVGPQNLAEMASAMRTRLQAIDNHPLLDAELKQASTVEFAQFETFMAFFQKASDYESLALGRIQAKEAAAAEEQKQQQLLQQQQQQQQEAAAPTTTAVGGDGAGGAKEGGVTAGCLPSVTRDITAPGYSNTVETQHFSLSASDISQIPTVDELSVRKHPDDWSVSELLSPSTRHARGDDEPMQW